MDRQIKDKVAEIIEKVMNSKQNYTVTYFKLTNSLNIYGTRLNGEEVELTSFNEWVWLDREEDVISKLDWLIERIE